MLKSFTMLLLIVICVVNILNYNEKKMKMLQLSGMNDSGRITDLELHLRKNRVKKMFKSC